jgi:FkbM family methyltransferase
MDCLPGDWNDAATRQWMIATGNRMFQLRKWYTFARARWHKRRTYGSSIDVLKAFFLRILTAERAGEKPWVLKGMWLTVKGLTKPVWIRCRSSDFFVFQEIFEGGEYRPIERWNLPANSVVVDLGGNVGLASAYFKAHLPGARIVVVEPDHENCTSISRTCVEMINSGTMDVVEAFASASDGFAAIDRNARSWAFKMMPLETHQHGNEPISCVSIPTLMRRHGLGQIDLLKCDIEGSEADLFTRCGEWIEHVNHLVVETHAPYHNRDLLGHLNAVGWESQVLSESQDEKVGLIFLKRTNAADRRLSVSANA